METLKPGVVLVWTTFYLRGVSNSYWLVLSMTAGTVCIVRVGDDNDTVVAPLPCDIDGNALIADLLINKREPGNWSFL